MGFSYEPMIKQMNYSDNEYRVNVYVKIINITEK